MLVYHNDAKQLLERVASWPDEDIAGRGRA